MGRFIGVAIGIGIEIARIDGEVDSDSDSDSDFDALHEGAADKMRIASERPRRGRIPVSVTCASCRFRSLRQNVIFPRPRPQ
jgi:hypothetical protein